MLARRVNETFKVVSTGKTLVRHKIAAGLLVLSSCVPGSSCEFTRLNSKPVLILIHPGVYKANSAILTDVFV
ncbi:hypothetical protein ACXR6G_08465 [Ancylomarina sp. YFZ004]